MAHWIYFELDEALPGTGCGGYPDECVKARARVIQYWQGEEPPTPLANDTLYVLNPPDNDRNDACLFQGSAGDRGLASLDEVEEVYRIVSLGSSRGHAVIRFRVLSLAPYLIETWGPCMAVNAEVLSVSCHGSVQVGDEVIVYDPSACWFSIPIEILEGAYGVAVQMDKGDYWDVPDCVDEIDSGSCWWLVQHLCCTEDVYYE
jgi:hypothetical protein